MGARNKRVKLPDVVVRSRRRANNWLIFLIICGFVVSVYFTSRDWSQIYKVLMMLTMLPLYLFMGIWFLWLGRRLDIAATQADFALCLHCGYNLTRVNLGGDCPQCSTTYDLEEVRACWQRWRPLWAGPKHKNSEDLGGKFKHVVLPVVIVRSRRFSRILCFLLMVTMLGSDVYLRNYPSPYINHTSKFVVIMALVLLVVTRAMRFERRLKNAALQADYALCLHCEYDLTGLDQQQHKCPECGTPYDLEYVRACWSNWRTMWEEAMG